MSMTSEDPGTDGAVDLHALANQQQPQTAVERFARQQSQLDRAPAERAGYYRDLIPLSSPSEGEQYAFEVDLDACSGCKACVAACHNLNGLDEHETWRSVGMLHGGTVELPILQHVTTACHHCLEPGCLAGCPVLAYEKDPLTGIVRHLDDQCIGCRYCMLMCPYDVPQYNERLGIVRKCDMCHHRLAAGEAPACVQACPTHAIRIRLVDQQTIVEESEANLFLPGSAEPGQTLPTTLYRTRRPLPRNLLPADYYAAKAQHGHLPLVFMLVLTQMSVGAFVAGQNHWLSAMGIEAAAVSASRPAHLWAALAMGLLGMLAAVLHLGRPQFAFRAVLGMRSSWLSREIFAFGGFALAAALYAASGWSASAASHTSPTFWSTAIGPIASLSGLLAIFCSVMVYAATGRPFWSVGPTTARFLLTAAVLGLPASLLVGLLALAINDPQEINSVLKGPGQLWFRWLILLATAKLALELSVFRHLRQKQHTPLKRTALLLLGELGHVAVQRFFFAVVGGILLPAILLAEAHVAGPAGYSPWFVLIAAALMFIVLLVGELMERYLFFAAVIAPKMPGVPGA